MEKVIANIPKIHYPLIDKVKGGRRKDANNDPNKAYQKSVL